MVRQNVGGDDRVAMEACEDSIELPRHCSSLLLTQIMFIMGWMALPKSVSLNCISVNSHASALKSLDKRR